MKRKNSLKIIKKSGGRKRLKGGGLSKKKIAALIAGSAAAAALAYGAYKYNHRQEQKEILTSEQPITGLPIPQIPIPRISIPRPLQIPIQTPQITTVDPVPEPDLFAGPESNLFNEVEIPYRPGLFNEPESKLINEVETPSGHIIPEPELNLSRDNPVKNLQKAGVSLNAPGFKVESESPSLKRVIQSGVIAALSLVNPKTKNSSVIIPRPGSEPSFHALGYDSSKTFELPWTGEPPPVSEPPELTPEWKNADPFTTSTMFSPTYIPDSTASTSNWTTFTEQDQDGGLSFQLQPITTSTDDSTTFIPNSTSDSTSFTPIPAPDSNPTTRPPASNNWPAVRPQRVPAQRFRTPRPQRGLVHRLRTTISKPTKKEEEGPEWRPIGSNKQGKFVGFRLW